MGSGQSAWFHDALLAPLSCDCGVHAPARRHHIGAVVDMGREGRVVGGLIGKTWSMALSERMRYHPLAVDANAGRMQIPTLILDPAAGQAPQKIEFTHTPGRRWRTCRRNGARGRVASPGRWALPGYDDRRQACARRRSIGVCGGPV